MDFVSKNRSDFRGFSQTAWELRSRVETLPERRILDDVTPKWTSAVFKKYKKSGKNARSPSRKTSKKLIEKKRKACKNHAEK